MEFQVLGPVSVLRDGVAIPLGGLKPRAVLAVLLLHAGEPVGVERLALALWGDEAPAGAVKTVQVHVSRLRRALGDPELITTTPAGYRLRLRPGELDAERFAQHVDAGQRALADGHPGRASELLRQGLALWRGPALADVAFEPFAPDEIARLEEQRLAALEACLEADLACGRHAAVAGELRQLMTDHPTREAFVRLRMLALYRAGRQTEALETFRLARRALVTQAGVEPGPELRRLHEAILRQDRSLEAPAAPPELPAELDATGAPPLVGRDEVLARLRHEWAQARTGERRVVALVGGSPGIGKTRLAAELAGEAHAAGAVVAYVAGRDAGAPATPSALRAVAGPTLVVADDADERGQELLRAAVNVAADAPVMVLVTGRDEGALGVGARDTLILTPLDVAGVREIARLAAPGDGGDVPAAALLEESGGVPRRVHEAVTRWSREVAARRVGAAADRTVAGRVALQAFERELAGSVIRLQAATEAADHGENGDGDVVCPFKGLAAFGVADAPYFFGRERLVAELVARLVGAPLLAVAGPSGGGKSSVLRAGLLPALAGGVLPGSATWRQAIIRPGEHPLAALTASTAGIGAGTAMVLAVDQFEETFTTCHDESERAAFVAELVRAHHANRIVVLAIRADYYGRCAAYPDFSRLLAAHHVLVGAMRRDELRRAVERPAQRVGLRVEPALTDALVADVEHEPGALPMLSTALLEMWQRRDGRQLRLATYEDTGGVRGAVARHAEEAFAQFDPTQRAIARRVLLRLVSESPDGAPERRRVPLTEFDDEVEHVVARLTEQRLLTVSAGSVELAHEALMREWPRFRGWLEEDAQGRRLHRHLASAAREWDAGGRDAGDLYRGARLAGALEWRAEHGPELNRNERDYLEASRAGELRELRAARLRRIRVLALAAALLVTITGVFAVLAIRGIQRSALEDRAAASRTLAALAAAQAGDDLTRAALLGLEAYRREPTVEARNAMLSVLPALAASSRAGRPLAHGVGLDAVAISPDGRTLASGTDVGTIWLWDVATRHRLGRPLAGHHDAVNDLAFSPDGRLLASAGEDATVVLWDVAGRRKLGPALELKTATATSVAFSPDGKTLAAAGGAPEQSAVSAGGGVVRLWDIRSRRPIGAPIRTQTQTAGDVAFSPDGALLAAAAGTAVRFWDATTRRPSGRPLGGPGEIVLAIAFSPDGATLASGSDDNAVRFWDVSARRALGEPLYGHDFSVLAVAFSPDGTTLASGASDATVRLWSAATHRSRGVLITDKDRPTEGGSVRVAGIRSVAFSPDGGILAAAGEEGAVRLWDLRGGRPPDRPLHGHADWINGLAFVSPTTLASAAADGTVLLWDPATQRRVGRPLNGGSAVLAVAGSPDGRTLAVARSDGTVRLWDAQTRRPRTGPLRAHAGAVGAVAFSPDGGRLATGGDDGMVRVWDAGTGRPLGPPFASALQRVRGVAFAPGADMLAAVGQDGTVRLLDPDDGTSLGAPLRGPTGFLAAVAFSPDGKTLAAAGGDMSVWLWDVDERRPLGPPLAGHTDVIATLAFSPDGKTLATGGADHTVRLWDVPSRQPLGQPLEGHTAWVSAVAFSPDGRRLASAGEDRTVRLWDPILWSDDERALRDRVCGLAQADLRRAEWAEFLPDQPYRRTCMVRP